MCLTVVFIAVACSVTAFSNGSDVYGSLALLSALMFIGLMLRNALHFRAQKGEES